MTTGSHSSGDGDLNWTSESWSGNDGKYNSDGTIRENTYSLFSFQHEGTKGTVYPDAFACRMNVYPASFAIGFGANAALAVINKVASKTREHSFNLGVAMGESRDTLRMAEEAVLTVGGVIRDLRHGQLKNAAHKLGLTHKSYKNSKSGSLVRGKTLQDRWLELQLGWLPTLGDVQSAAIATAKAQNVINRRTRVQGFTAVQANYQPSDSPSNVPGKGDVVYKRSFRYYLSEKNNSRPSFAENMGLDDPFSIAWELIPMSFVFDYFIPVGDYLQAINSLPKLDGSLWYTDSREWNATSLAPVQNHQFYASCKTSANGCSVERYRETTSGLAAMDLPLPTFNKLSKALSPIRFGNMLALTMSSAFGLKPPRKSSTWTGARAQHYEQSASAYRKTI